MLYRLLYWTNRFLLKFRREIRKKNASPFYYLQAFPLPDLPNENGIYSIPIDKIISPHFFSYGPKGWHYYTAFLKQYESTPDITYSQSVLKQYYDNFQPESAADILFHDNPDSAPNAVKDLPALAIRDFWRLDGTPQEIKTHIIDEETQLFGPLSDMYGEEQMIRCQTAYRLIRKHGYIPDRFEDGYIGGYFFVNGNDYRFLAMAGKHRLAALGTLGFKNIKVTTPYNLKVLDIQKVNAWPTVRSGLFTKDQIQTIFQKAFTENGTAFARKHNLLT